MLPRALAALALLALAACADGGPAGRCGLSLAADIPVDTAANRTIVSLDVGGRSARFLLDTGAASIVMTRAAAARLGAEVIADGAADVGGVGGTTVGGSARLRGAMLGGLRLPERTVTLVADTSTTARAAGGTDGILGIKDLAGYEWDLDLPAHRIRLYAGTPCRGEALPTAPGLVDVRRSWTSHPGFDGLDPRSHLAVTLDGRPLVALLDTGAQGSLLFRHAAAKLGITDEALARDPRITARGIGPVTLSSPVHGFATMEIGGRVFRNPKLAVVEFGDTDTRTYYEVDMLLGVDYLKAHRVWIAHDRRVVLVPGPQGAP